jgi:RNA polymerase sigma-70 factor (ECF subfamily)
MAAGEQRAFEEFVDTYGARIHRLVKRYVSNPADADDVTQEIFIDLYRCIPTYRGGSSLMTWVYRIAVNHCLRHCERSRPSSPFDDEILEMDDDWRSNPVQAAAKGELSDYVHSALGVLPQIHKDVVVLHELHGLTYEECAEMLEVPVGTVKSRLSNAFRKLRVNLSDYVLGDSDVNRSNGKSDVPSTVIPNSRREESALSADPVTRTRV